MAGNLFEYVNVLKKTGIFRGLSPFEIKSILPCLRGSTLSYKKDEFILMAGDKIDYLGVILEGSAIIIKEDYWGRRSILDSLVVGDVFGEAYGFLPDATSRVSVLTTSNVSLAYFKIDNLITMCGETCTFHTKLVKNLLQVLSTKNISLTDKIQCISKKTIRERLLDYLSLESIKHGTSTFTIPYSRQELADYLSVDRSALSNEISKLQKEGLIKSHKNKFTIFDHEVY